MPTKEPYEYLPPHGGPQEITKQTNKPESLWEVSVPWGSETVVRRVMARDKNHALRKVGMEISRSVNLAPAKVFMQINREKKFQVTEVNSAFVQRALSL